MSNLIRYLRSFFSNGHHRSLKARKNILVSLLCKGVGMVIMFLMVRLSLDYLGPAKYGVWIVLSGVIGWAGMFDFGLSHGLRNYLTTALANKEKSLAKSYVSTTYLLLFAVTLCLLLFGAMLIHFLDLNYLLNLNDSAYDNIDIIAYWVLIFFAIGFFLKPTNSILQAYQIPSYIQVIGVLGSVLSIILLYFFYIYPVSNSFIIYAIIVAGSPVLALFVASIYLFIRKSNIAPSFNTVKLKYLRKLGGLGSKFFIIQLCLLVVFSTDNILITYLFGPTEVAVYNIPYKYYSILVIFFSQVMNPYWSAITDAYAKKELEWIHNTIKNLFKIVAVGTTVAILMYLVSDYIFDIWIGNRIENIPWHLTACMGLYAVMIGLQKVFSSFSNGIGKVAVVMITYIVAAIFNLPLSYFLGKTLGFGSTGVLLATITCLVFISSILFIQYYKIIKGKAYGIWVK